MDNVKYPIGVQDFEKLRKEGNLYVDKTGYIRKLVEKGSIYFLGRPRRFGKSLLLSTMHAFFEGKRELFKGLEIDGWEEWGWEEYPVLHIDLNAKDYTYKESLEEKINAQLLVYEEKYGVVSPDPSLDGRLTSIIKKANAETGLGVVVLIDEYDKPILDTMHDDSLKDMHRGQLRAFYSSLKSCDRYLKFCFLTGVTKFGQLNIFSGLNNIQDISLWDEFAGVCGITEEELHANFESGVDGCARKWGCTIEDAFKILKDNYDGYHFSPCLLDVYNPWSVLNVINQQFIDTYWNQTGGGMSFIYNMLRSDLISLTDLDDCTCTPEDLKGTRVDIDDPIPIMYQSGYLTIKRYDSATREFTLKYPNNEVERGFLNGLLPEFSGETPKKSYAAVKEFVKDVNNGDVDGFLERMQTFFEDFPYENALKTERQFQNIMYCITAMMGLQTQIERHSSRGSSDMIIQTKDYVYVMEFKVDRSPEAALEQIEKKRYAVPFAKDPRTLFKVGVEFSLADRNIARWKIAN